MIKLRTGNGSYTWEGWALAAEIMSDNSDCILHCMFPARITSGSHSTQPVNLNCVPVDADSDRNLSDTEGRKMRLQLCSFVQQKEKWSTWIRYRYKLRERIEMVALFLLENTWKYSTGQASTLFDCKRSVRGIQAIKGSTLYPAQSTKIGGKAASAVLSSALPGRHLANLRLSWTPGTLNCKLNPSACFWPLSDHSITKLCHQIQAVANPVPTRWLGVITANASCICFERHVSFFHVYAILRGWGD